MSDPLVEYLERSVRQRQARLRVTPDDAKIWRYMDFSKLVSMLEDKALFFARADAFEDAFEGSYPLANVKARQTEDRRGPIKFIAFDPTKDSNNIKGRYHVSDALQLQNYPNRLEVGKEITEDEFNSQPEIYMDVDVGARRLVPVSSDVAKSRGAGTASREESERADREFHRQVADAQSKLFKSLRMYTFINCWHVAEHESAAMWRLYGKEGSSIAVQSTYGRLRGVLLKRIDKNGSPLDGHVDLALVQYVDYRRDRIPEGYLFDAFLYKRKSFEHERELRAFFQETPKPGAGHGELVAIPPPEKGRQVPLDLDQLIEAIYVAPSSAASVHDLVKKVCARYCLNKPVNCSSLDENPSY